MGKIVDGGGSNILMGKIVDDDLQFRGKIHDYCTPYVLFFILLFSPYLVFDFIIISLRASEACEQEQSEKNARASERAIE